MVTWFRGALLNSKKNIQQSIKEKGPWLVVGLLSLLILWTLAYFISSLVQLHKTPVHKIRHTHVGKQPLLLAEESLFGQYDKKMAAQKADIGLTVVGLVADPVDPESSTAMAVVKNQQGKSKIIHIGSTLDSSYTVTKILTKKIMMENEQGFPYYLALVKPPSLELH